MPVSTATTLLAQHGATKRVAASASAAMRAAGLPTTSLDQEEVARCRGLEAALAGSQAERARFATLTLSTLHAASLRKVQAGSGNPDLAIVLDAHVSALRNLADIAHGLEKIMLVGSEGAADALSTRGVELQRVGVGAELLCVLSAPEIDALYTTLCPPAEGSSPTAGATSGTGASAAAASGAAAAPPLSSMRKGLADHGLVESMLETLTPDETYEYWWTVCHVSTTDHGHQEASEPPELMSFIATIDAAVEEAIAKASASTASADKAGTPGDGFANMDAFAAQAAASIEKRWLLQAMPPPLIVPKGHTPLGALVSSSTAADVLDAPLASPLAQQDRAAKRAQQHPPRESSVLSKRGAEPAELPEPRRNPFAVWQQHAEESLRETREHTVNLQTSARWRAEGEARRQQHTPTLAERMARDAAVEQQQARLQAERAHEEAVLQEYERRNSTRAPPPSSVSRATPAASGDAQHQRVRAEAEMRARLDEQKQEAEAAEAAEVRRVEAAIEARSSASSSSSTGSRGSPRQPQPSGGQQPAQPAKAAASPPPATAAPATEASSSGSAMMYAAIDSLSKWWYG